MRLLRPSIVLHLEVEAEGPFMRLADAFVNAAELYTDTPCDPHFTNIAWSDNRSF